MIEEDNPNFESSKTIGNPPILDPSVQANTTAVRIQSAFRRLVIVTLILGLGLAAVAFYGYNIASKNTKGLCALRNDAQTRIDQGQEFLKDHPKGIQGISVNVIRENISNSVRTAKALKEISCPPPAPLLP